MELSPKDEILFVHKLTLEHKTNQNFSNSISEITAFVINWFIESAFFSSFSVRKLGSFNWFCYNSIFSKLTSLIR